MQCVNDNQDQNRGRFSVKCGKSWTAFGSYLPNFIVNPPWGVWGCFWAISIMISVLDRTLDHFPCLASCKHIAG